MALEHPYWPPSPSREVEEQSACLPLLGTPEAPSLASSGTQLQTMQLMMRSVPTTTNCPPTHTQDPLLLNLRQMTGGQLGVCRQWLGLFRRALVRKNNPEPCLQFNMKIYSSSGNARVGTAHQFPSITSHPSVAKEPAIAVRGKARYQLKSQTPSYPPSISCQIFQALSPYSCSAYLAGCSCT